MSTTDQFTQAERKALEYCQTAFANPDAVKNAVNNDLENFNDKVTAILTFLRDLRPDEMGLSRSSITNKVLGVMKKRLLLKQPWMSLKLLNRPGGSLGRRGTRRGAVQSSEDGSICLTRRHFKDAVTAFHNPTDASLRSGHS